MTIAVWMLALILQGSPEKPTLDQCHADAGAWIALRFNKSGWDDVPFPELRRREDEMYRCFSAEPPAIGEIRPDTPKAVIETREMWQDRYDQLEQWFKMRMYERLENYIYRHKLFDKFLVEDAAGERDSYETK
jgi:hypothetical protein